MSGTLFDPDRDLHDRFQALRRADAASAPPFSTATRPATHSLASRWSALSPRARLGTATVGLATLAAIVSIVIATRPPGRPTIEKAIAQAREMGAWTAPTDALLVTTDLKIPDSISTPPSESVKSGAGSDSTIPNRLD